jgi:hypothetical protein
VSSSPGLALLANRGSWPQLGALCECIASNLFLFIFSVQTRRLTKLMHGTKWESTYFDIVEDLPAARQSLNVLRLGA